MHASSKSESVPSSTFVAVESRLSELENAQGFSELVCVYPDLWSAVTELHRCIDLMNPDAQLNDQSAT